MSSTEIEDACRSIDAEIGYLVQSAKRNRRFCSPHADLNTAVNELRRIKIRDGRAIQDQFTLDRHGFVLALHVSAVSNFEDPAQIKAAYEPEAIALVKRLTGADRVVSLGTALRTAGNTVSRGMQPPAAEAHVDFESRAARAYARSTYEQAFPGGPGYGRFIASSLWRPISAPPHDWPLAVCDWRSVRDDEGVRNVMVVVDRIPEGEALFADIPGEEDLPAAYIFPYSAEHRWWYFSNMTRDEVLFFKFHDSDQSRAWRVPHTAFRDESVLHPNIRESIEFRSFAYFDSSRSRVCATE